MNRLRFQVREKHSVRNNSLRRGDFSLAFHLHFVRIMQMATQIAIAESIPPPSTEWKSADLDSNSFAPRLADTHEFATGLRSLLAEMGSAETDGSSPSMPGIELSQNAPAPNHPRGSEGAAVAETGSVTEDSVPGFTSEPTHHKLSPSVQLGFLQPVQQKRTNVTLEMKESKCVRANPSSIPVHLRGAGSAQPPRQSDASTGLATAPVDLPTTAPVDAFAPVATKPTSDDEPTQCVVCGPRSAIEITALHERETMEPQPVAIAADHGDFADPKHAVSPQEDEPTGALHPESAVNLAQASFSPSLLPTEQAAASTESARAQSESLTGKELKTPVADALNPSVDSIPRFNPSSPPSHSRRIDTAPSAFQVSRSGTRGAVASAAGDAVPMHAPLQGAIANAISASMPIRDAPILDRHSNLPYPATSSFPAASGERDAFATLDSATAGPETTWIHAGAHHAEAGYLDPSLGWVTVRADGTSGGVHAAVVPGSPEAASVLSNHLAGLNAFMAGHQGHSATVTLASLPTEGSHLGHSEQDGAMNGQQNQQQQQGRSPSAPFTHHSKPSSVSLDIESAANPIAVQPATRYNGSGVHLSVMA
jgi:hypothetical protein